MKSILLVKKLLGLVEMMTGLVNASFSLPGRQAVKKIAPCILEYLGLSITKTKKAIFRLSSTWSWHVYTIVRDTRSSCGGTLTWKAQIHDGGHRVNFDRNLPSSCFVVQYNSLISMI